MSIRFWGGEQTEHACIYGNYGYYVFRSWFVSIMSDGIGEELRSTSV